MVTARLVLAIAAGAAAGCYQPSPPNGALLCSLDSRCPEGYRCVQGACWRNGGPGAGTGDGPAEPDAAIDASPPFTWAPLLVSPRNGASTGSDHAALSRHPLLRWRTLPEATSYEIQVDDSCDPKAFRGCSFPSPEAAETAATATWRLSTALAVSATRPDGRRYYWRVRGCGGDRCTPWSEVRYLDVGRNPTDFTGDGHSDLMIGSDTATINGGSSVGAVYIADGGTAAQPPLRVLTAPGGAAQDRFGTTVASAGDVDGDGYVDLAVAARMADESGHVYFYRGGQGAPSATPSQILANPEGQTGAWFGYALAGGDLDGDGRSDLVVGAPRQTGSVRFAGKVFGYTGQASSTGLATAPSWTLDNPSQQGGEFGNALAIGDFDGDGYADLAVGARSQDVVGRVFVYRGGPGGVAGPPAAALDDPVILSNAFFGYALAAGDFDGDGYADLAVSAIGPLSEAGHVYVFHGGPGGIADRAAPWRTLDNPTHQAGATFGYAVVAADFNTDDLDDLVVTANGQDTLTGRVYVYQSAATGLPDQPTTTLNDPAPAKMYDSFGLVLAAGDHFPSDGRADLFVAAVRDSGTIYVFDGSAGGLPAAASSTLTSPMVPGGRLGPSSLSSAAP